jgi:hypothetical protein
MTFVGHRSSLAHPGPPLTAVGVLQGGALAPIMFLSTVTQLEETPRKNPLLPFDIHTPVEFYSLIMPSGNRIFNQTTTQSPLG